MAFPIKNNAGNYNVVIYDMVNRKTLFILPNSRQPNFHPKFSHKLLVNGQGGGESIYQYDLKNRTCNGQQPCRRQISGEAKGHRPVYSPSSSTNIQNEDVGAMIFEKWDGSQWKGKIHKGLNEGDDESTLSFSEVNDQDKDMVSDQPLHLFWVNEGTFIFKSCNNWAGGSDCGIWRGGESGPKTKLKEFEGYQPTDAKGNNFVYMAQLQDTWDVFNYSLDGSHFERNVSEAPNSNDILGTISPDGEWIAFMSDRGGSWGIWVASALDPSIPPVSLPIDQEIKWAGSEFTEERMSWGR